MDIEELLSLISHLISDPFDGWSEMLQKGEECIDQISKPSEPWCNLEIILNFKSEIRNIIDQCGLDTQHYPWRMSRKLDPPIQVEVSLKDISIEFMKNKTEGNRAYAFLALISVLDDKLKGMIRSVSEDSGYHEKIISGFREKALLKLPLTETRYWIEASGKFCPKSRNYTFHDGLVSFVSTKNLSPMKLIKARDVGISDKVSTEMKLNIGLIVADVIENQHFTATVKKHSENSEPVFQLEHTETILLIDEAVEKIKKNDEEFKQAVENIDILVLPEFSVSEGDRINLQHYWEGLTPILIAGSGHTEIDGKNANRSTIVHSASPNHINNPGVAHLKVRAFELRKKDGNSFEELCQSCKDRSLLESLNSKGCISECLELTGGSQEYPLILIDSKWGRLSFLICRDYLEDFGPGLLHSLNCARVDHLFVPSYNPGSYSEFEKNATTLSKKYQLATYYIDGCSKNEKSQRVLVSLPLVDKNNRGILIKEDTQMNGFSMNHFADHSIGYLEMETIIEEIKNKNLNSS